MSLPVPQKDHYWSTMLEWGGYLSTWLANKNATPNDAGLANVYYDGELCGYRLLDYSGDAPTWSPYIQRAFDAYVTYYSEPINGKVSGYRNFTGGQLEDVLRSTQRSIRSLHSLNNHLTNGSFVSDGNLSLANPSTPNDGSSRECAYALQAHIHAARAGIVLNYIQIARREQLFEWCLGHLDQWVTSTATYCRPFMVGLTCNALIEYFTYVNKDPRIVPKIRSIADYIWSKCWRATAFTYTDRETGNADPKDLVPQPDLNMLIAPLFGFIYRETGTQIYRDKGDLVFQGGIAIYKDGFYVSGTYLGTQNASNPAGKQFNQQLFWGPKYIAFAES